jgi:hypothetical protein
MFGPLAEAAHVVPSTLFKYDEKKNRYKADKKDVFPDTDTMPREISLMMEKGPARRYYKYSLEKHKDGYRQTYKEVPGTWGTTGSRLIIEGCKDTRYHEKVVPVLKHMPNGFKKKDKKQTAAVEQSNSIFA